MEAVLKRESMADARLSELGVPELAVQKPPGSSKSGKKEKSRKLRSRSPAIAKASSRHDAGKRASSPPRHAASKKGNRHESSPSPNPRRARERKEPKSSQHGGQKSRKHGRDEPLCWGCKW